MARLGETFAELINRLRDNMPAREGGGLELSDPWLRCVDALLGQYLSEGPRRRVLNAFVEHGFSDARTVSSADALEFESIGESAGLPSRQKWIQPLKRFASWYERENRGDSIGAAPTEQIRAELRELRGFGPTAVEAMLLFGMGRLAYPVDRATVRVLFRHGWADPPLEFDETRELLEGLSPDRPDQLRVLSAGLRAVAKQFCLVKRAECEHCPLRCLLPAGGPRLFE